MSQSSPPIASDSPIAAPERRILDRLVDLMIPESADGVMPGAGTLDLYRERGRLTDAALAALREGARGLGALARARLQADFVALDTERAMTVVNEYRALAPEFFGVFVTQSAARYYQHDRVLLALGLEPRAPWPQGNQVAEGDWSLLDPVRERAAAHGVIYREV
jgi:hypothetical protein